MIKQAIILAGGKGTRLGGFTKNIPKPMLEVGGKPFLEFLVWNLARQGVSDILIFAGYKSEKIKEYFHNKFFYGSFIKVLIEEIPLGTGGCLKKHKEYLDDRFWLLNGDTFFDSSLLEIFQQFSEDDEIIINGTLIDDPDRYGSLVIDSQNYVLEFNEKKRSGESLISAGIYLLHKKYITNLPDGFISLEKDIFPNLAKHKKIKLFVSEAFFIDIGIPDSLAFARDIFDKKMRKPALFIDRDGTINEDSGYTHKIEDLKLVKGAAEVIKLANKRGFYVILITNQGGISKGIFSQEQMEIFNEGLINKLRSLGANLDFVYFCPHHPEAHDAKMRQCECRKPKSGLIDKALTELPILKERSFMLGDDEKDVEAALNAGIPGYQFKGESLLNFVIKGNLL